jgi:hypothetical protein
VFTLPFTDCNIELLPKSEPLSGPFRHEQNHWQMKENSMWIRIPSIAEFTVTEGKSVCIFPLRDNIDPLILQHFLLSTPYAALCLQRDELPLHAAALTKDGASAILICAHSGTGKSTTAAALCQAGWSLLNDDISRLTLENDHLMVHPASQSIRLWPDSCAKLEVDTPDLSVAFGPKNKYLWPAPSCPNTLPVLCIVELVRPLKDDFSSVSGWQRMAGGEIFGLTRMHTFRPPLIPGLGKAATHFKFSAHIATHCPVYRLVIDATMSPQDVAASIEEHFHHE